MKDPLNILKASKSTLQDTISSLKSLHETWSKMDQIDDASIFDPHITVLGSERFLKHKDPVIQLCTANCIIDLLKLCAPNCPFSQIQLDDLFKLLIQCWRSFLQDQNHVHYNSAYMLLNNMTFVRSSILILEVSEPESTCQSLFSTFLFLSGARQYDNSLYSLMIDFISQLIEESDMIPASWIDTLIIQPLLSHSSTDHPISHFVYQLTFAAAERLYPYLYHYYHDKLKDELLDSDNFHKSTLDRLKKYMNILVGLYINSSPTLLLSIYPLLESLLIHDNSDIRNMLVQTIGQLIDPKSPNNTYIPSLENKSSNLYQAWIQRTQDKSYTIRINCLYYIIKKLCRYISISDTITTSIDELSTTIQHSLLDPDERVRLYLIEKLFDLFDDNVHGIKLLIHSKTFSNAIVQRLQDKKESIRKATFTLLCNVCKIHLNMAHDIAINESLVSIHGHLFKLMLIFSSDESIKKELFTLFEKEYFSIVIQCNAYRYMALYHHVLSVNSQYMAGWIQLLQLKFQQIYWIHQLFRPDTELVKHLSHPICKFLDVNPDQIYELFKSKDIENIRKMFSIGGTTCLSSLKLIPLLENTFNTKGTVCCQEMASSILSNSYINMYRIMCKHAPSIASTSILGSTKEQELAILDGIYYANKKGLISNFDTSNLTKFITIPSDLTISLSKHIMTLYCISCSDSYLCKVILDHLNTIRLYPILLTMACVIAEHRPLWFQSISKQLFEFINQILIPMKCDYNLTDNTIDLMHHIDKNHDSISDEGFILSAKCISLKLYYKRACGLKASQETLDMYLKGCQRHFLSILQHHNDSYSFYAFKYFIRMLRWIDHDISYHLILVRWWEKNLHSSILIHDMCKLIQSGKLHPCYIAYLALVKNTNNNQLCDMIKSWIKQSSILFIQNNSIHIMNSAWMLFMILLSKDEESSKWIDCIEFFISYADNQSLNYIMNMTVEIKKCSLVTSNTNELDLSSWTRRLWMVCELVQLILDQICHKNGWILSKGSTRLPSSLFKEQEYYDSAMIYLPKELRMKFSKQQIQENSNNQQVKSEYISPRPARIAKTMAMDSIKSIEYIQDED